MTGFGDARDQCADYSIAVEVRTINSRYLKLNLRTTEGFSALDARIESIVREYVKRGTVQLNIRIKHLVEKEDYSINPEVLGRYIEQLQTVACKRGFSEEIQLEQLCQLPGVIVESAAAAHEPEQLWAIVEPTVRTALENLTLMRHAEGEALAADLAAQCETIDLCLVGIESRKNLVVENYQKRLHERIQEALATAEETIDSSDLLREICLFAERADISEETVRLHSHLKQFQKTMGQPDQEPCSDASASGATAEKPGASSQHRPAGPQVRTDQDGLGRKLEFICQEMGRETNTIGSKANDTTISQHVVEIKTSLERIREQIQNVQ
jgi:uncharacterized protein (TIGR00255 family)